MSIKESENTIFRNLIKLLTGEGIGRIIGLLVTPIITRIYGPGNMGVLTVFISIVAIIGPFACLSYPSSIPIDRNNNVAFNIICGSFLILTVTTLITCAVFYIGGNTLFEFLSIESIINYWWLIPIGLLFKGTYDILTQYNVRNKTFANLAKATVSQKIIGSLTKIALGMLQFKPVGLLIGDVLTTSGGITVLGRSLVKECRNSYKQITILGIKNALIRYKSFPVFRLPSQALLQLSGNLPILFFAWRFNDVTIGQIGLARTMLSMPVTFIGTSVGRAFLGEVAQIGMNNGNTIYKITIDVMRRLFLFSLIPFLLVVLFGPWIFQIVFGSEWYDSGLYARMMAIYLIFQFMYSPIEEGIFNVFEKQHLVLLVESCRITIILTVLSLSYYFELSSMHTVLIYSIGLALQYLIGLAIILNVIRNSRTK